MLGSLSFSFPFSLLLLSSSSFFFIFSFFRLLAIDRTHHINQERKWMKEGIRVVQIQWDCQLELRNLLPWPRIQYKDQVDRCNWQ